MAIGAAQPLDLRRLDFTAQARRSATYLIGGASSLHQDQPTAANRLSPARLKTLFFCAVFFSAVSATAKERSLPAVLIVATDRSCQLTVPASWAKLDNLNRSAVLQAGNIRTGEYVILLNESRAESTGSLDDYLATVSGHLLSAGTVTGESAPKSLVCNGLPARLRAFSATIKRRAVVYYTAVIAGRYHWFQVDFWTTPAKRAGFEGKVDAVLGSFKELTGG